MRELDQRTEGCVTCIGSQILCVMLGYTQIKSCTELNELALLSLLFKASEKQPITKDPSPPGLVIPMQSEDEREDA